MKKIVLFVLISISVGALSQLNSHFSSPTAKWNVVATYPHANEQHPSFVEQITKVYGFIGDTIIASNSWLKIFGASNQEFTQNLNLIGAIREANGLILYDDLLGNPIDTIYNFNLNLGDSVAFNFSGVIEKIPIIEVGAIEMNGEYFQTYTFAEPTSINAFTVFNEKWIEGIGSIHGPLFPLNPRVFSTEVPDSVILSCSKIDEVIYWENQNFEACFFYRVLELEEFRLSSILMYPNPTNGQFYLFNSSYDKLVVYDNLGKVVFEKRSSMNNNYIDISFLSEGNYLLEIIHQNQVRHEKIVIEK